MPVARPPSNGRHNGDPGDELIAFLEPDQLVADKAVPIPRVSLSRRANAGLWALRVFALIMSAMVIYTFIFQLA